MTSQSAGTSLPAFDNASLGGSDQGGRDAVPGNRAWSSTELPSDMLGGDEDNSSANLAYSGEAFIFEPDWLSSASAVVSPSASDYTIDFPVSVPNELASLSANALVLADAGDIPIWSLGTDDFNF